MAGRLSSLGIGSGIDVQSLLNAVREQLELPIRINEQKADRAEAAQTAIGRLRSMLSQLSESLDPLRTTNGGARAKQSTSSAPQVGSAIASSAAADGSTTVTVSQLATSGRVTFDRELTSASEALGSAGTVSVTVGEGEAAKQVAVEVGADTTAEQFVASFNANAGGTAQASLVNVGTSGSPKLKIVIQARETGLEKGSIAVSPSGAPLSEPPPPAPGGADGSTNLQTAQAVTPDGESASGSPLGSAVITQATDLQVSVPGISGTLTSGKNSIEISPGVTFEAKSTGTTVITTRSAANDAAARVEQFVSTFNELQRFIRTEDAVIPGAKLGDAPQFGALSGTSVDEQLSSSLRAAISSSGVSSTSLAALGITTARDGSLAFDKKKFEAAYSSNPDGAAATLEKLADRVSGVGGFAYDYTKFQGRFDLAEKKSLDELKDIDASTERLTRRVDAQIARVERQFQELDKFAAKFSVLGQTLSGLIG